MKVVFMGTPDFAASALKTLAASNHEVVGVYTQPPRPAGRGQADQPSAVAVTAKNIGIPVFTPTSLKPDGVIAELTTLGADIGVVAAYGLILPQAVLDAFPRGCVNIHASLLPRWRGAAPIHRAIMAGDTETGITIMQMDAGLDTGPMLMAKATPITPQDTTPSLHDRLRDMGAEMIVGALDAMEAGTLVSTPQPLDGATYADKIDKAEAKIDWAKSAIDIDRQVRALTPFPGAWFEHDGIRIKVHAGMPKNAKGSAGVTLDDALLIGTGDGAYRITVLQPAGKPRMETNAYLRGKPITKGTHL